ncbi:hypothetical protein F4824DRAFT_31901 [Ustulina deusta]|nr:hypothetical protein F4824DRAFT_31901 [Ustulina deusta]
MDRFRGNQDATAMTARAGQEANYFVYNRRRRHMRRRNYGRPPRRGGPSLWGWEMRWKLEWRLEWKIPQMIRQSSRQLIPVVARALRAARTFVLALVLVFAMSALRAVGMVSVFFLLTNWRGYLRLLVEGVADAWAAFASSYWHGDSAAPSRR